MRKDWDTYFMDIAYEVKERSTCDRLHVGAVIVKDKRIKGTGYNGSPAGLVHCDEDGCLVVNNHCIRTIHAEVNAILECTPEERNGATVYITARPCAECSKIIINSGIKRVVYAEEYHIDHDFFKEATWIELVYLKTKIK